MTYFKLHLIELKYNLIIFLFSFIHIYFFCSLYSDQVIFLFIKPLLNIVNLKYFIYTDVTEFFFLNFYISIILSIIILIPFTFLQFWFFLSKGFTKKENKKFLKFFIFFFFLIFFFLLLFF